MQREFPAEIRNSNGFSRPKQVISKKKVFIPRMSLNYENFGLDLHYSSPEPVNFFGAQSSLGGAQFSFGGHKKSFGGARPRYAPRGAGSGSLLTKNTVSRISRLNG